MDGIHLGSMEAFLFDLDGCLYYGHVPAKGARLLLELLKEEGKSCFFVTNNSTHTSHEISDRLVEMGLPAIPDQVITATELTGLYMKDNFGVMKVKVVGSEGLLTSLELAGHRVIPSDSQEVADMVIIGRDVDFHYGKLQWIAEAERRGSKVIGTNPDGYHIGSQGEKVPETGALIAAIEMMIGKTIEYVGKPSPYLFQYVMKKYNMNAEECVMVGDNINTDMLGGIQAGMRTVWIKGQKNDFVPNESSIEIKPDLVVESIEQLLNIYMLKQYSA